MFGINRCKIELLNRLSSDVDKIKIDYNPKNRILNFLDFLTYAPFSTLKNRRKDAIAHILSHSEAHLLYFLKFKKSVVTCYDITPFLYDYGNPLSRRKVRWSFKAMTKADHIISISQFTKDEIVKYFDYPAENITVATIGVDLDTYKPLTDLEETRKKFNLFQDNKYIIYVGNEEPRMNVDVIVKALKELKEKHPTLKFLKVGEPNMAGARDKLLDQIKTLGLEDDIIFTGYVSEFDMPRLYNLADVSVYICSYTGFGLPPLEGMACGTPTITSNAATLPEIAGEGAITIPPTDHIALTEAIDKLLTNKEFAKELSEKGKLQASKFTWDNWVKTTEEVYKTLLNTK
ncbi:MAG: glycosyltransferase family 1 protein [Nanoarchaeota archaeon]|nr:glycosyltransferase family 1 protein [Nanoarchaeota archaeon]